MDNDIQVGDLVVIVGTPCCKHLPDPDLGSILQVIDVSPRGGHCPDCQRAGPVEPLYLFQSGRGCMICGRPRSCLKKIPPLRDLEGLPDHISDREKVTV